MSVSNAAGEKSCQYCAETIKAEAIVCKHCGRRVATRRWLMAIPAGALIVGVAIWIQQAAVPEEVKLARQQLAYCQQTMRQAGAPADGCKTRYEERLRLLGYENHL